MPQQPSPHLVATASLPGGLEGGAGTWAVPMAASEKALAAGRRGGVQGPQRRALCEWPVPMATTRPLHNRQEPSSQG